MRKRLFTLSVPLLAALWAGCGGGSEEAATTTAGTGGGTSTTTGSGGSTTTSGTGGTSTGTGGTTGSGGAPIADPSKGGWRSGFGSPGLAGFASRASAVVHGADGKLYVGGIFVDAAGTPANNVAAWNGSAWEALGAGLPGPVNALAFGADGKLYAGGAFNDASTPANHLARWDGTQWTLLPGDFDGEIRAVAAQGSRILVAGTFAHADGIDTHGVAAFDANGWSAIGTTGTDFDVDTILVKDAQAFCIGGVFSTVDDVPANNAACWDGAAWSQLGDGLPGGVSRLAQGPDGKLYAGGTLTFVVDPSAGVFISGIAVLEGQTWQPFAGGIDNGSINEVRAIAFAPDGDLLIGGTFGSAGYDAPIQASNAARYDFGTKTWSELGGGVDNAVGVSIGAVTGVNDILVLGDGSFVVGGLYSSVSSNAVQAANIGRLQGSTWNALVAPSASFLGIGGLINSMSADEQGRIVAGGYFPTAGGAQAANIARLGVSGWEPLGEGTDADVFVVHTRTNGDILAGGYFAQAGGVAAPFLARWNGSKWTTFGDPLDGLVDAIAEDAHGGLYIGGDFTTAAGTTLNRIAHWDGSKWEALGGGLDGRVTSIAVDAKGNVIAVGLFEKASGGVTANGVAMWDGTAWKGFGQGLSSYGSRVIADGDGFIVSGTFDTVDGHPFSGVARWDGTQWSGFGQGLSTASGYGLVVADVVRYGDGLFATGTFDQSGTTPLGHVAWFDGNAWKPLDSGLDDLGQSLVVAGNTLWVGGTFLRAGGLISTAIGAWDFGK